MAAGQGTRSSLWAGGVMTGSDRLAKIKERWEGRCFLPERDVEWLVAALVAERATNERLRELLEKCACGVDYPDDVCLVHSPQLVAERALSDALAAALETLCNEPTHPYIDEWYNVRKASQAALAAHRSARAERHDSA